MGISRQERVAVAVMAISLVAALIFATGLALPSFDRGHEPVPAPVGSRPAILGGPHRIATADAPTTAATAGGPRPSGTQLQGSTPFPSTSGPLASTTAGARSDRFTLAEPGVPSGGTTPAGTGSGAVPARTPSNPSEGVTDDTILVGGIYDETGPVDATVARDTVRAWFNAVNERGGVGGRRLRLLDCDSGFDPSRAHHCSDELLSQKVLAIVGWSSASGEEPETRYLTGQGVPILGGLSTAAEFNNPLAFPTMPSLNADGMAMGRHARDLGLTDPAVIVLNLPIVAPLKGSLLAALHEGGIAETSVDEVDATKADYTDLVIKLRAEGATSIIGALDPFSYARLYQAAERQNWKVPVFGFGLDKRSANEAYGPGIEGAESFVPYTEAFDPAVVDQPDVVEYFSTIRRYYPRQVQALDVYTEAQWVAAKVFVEALRRIHGPISRQSLAGALETLRDVKPGLAPSVSYLPGNHEPNRCFRWIRYHDRAWHMYSDYHCFSSRRGRDHATGAPGAP